MMRWLALAWTALLLASCSSEPPPPPPQPEDLGSLDPAVRELIETRLAAIEASPDEAEPRFALALVYDANGLTIHSRETYRQVIAMAPEKAGPRHRLALAEEVAGDLGAAAAAMREAIDLAPDHSGAHWQLGLWLLDLGRFADAEYHLGRAIELEPSGAPARFGMIRLHLERANPEEAERLARTMVDSRFSAYAHRLLATALHQQGRHDEAGEAAEHAGPAPDFSSAWNDVLRPLRRGLASRKQDVVALFEAGRADEAMQLILEILEDSPDDPDILVNLAIAQAGRGEIRGARETLEKAILSENMHYAANLNMALVTNRLGSQDASLLPVALMHAERAASVRPDAGAPHRARGDILSQMQRAADALQAYEEAFRLDGRNPAPLVQAGAMLLRLGQLDAAASTYQRALDCSPTDLSSILGMASTRLAQRRLDEATRLLDHAQTLPGVNPQRLLGLRQRIANARSGG